MKALITIWFINFLILGWMLLFALWGVHNRLDKIIKEMHKIIEEKLNE